MVTPGEDILLRWAGRLSGSAKQVDRLSSTVLASVFPAANRMPEHSALNNDGSPLQVCLTYDERGRRWRLIGDPAAGVRPAETRLALARQALRETLGLTRSKGMEKACRTMLTYALPPDGSNKAMDAGTFWLAAGLEGGAAVYANMRWGAASERWADVRRWLRAALPEPATAIAMVNRLEPVAQLASVGMEGSKPENARLKLYWRLQGRTTFADMGVPPYWNGDAGRVVAEVSGGVEMPFSGLVISASYRLANGGPADVKLDFCAHCLGRTGKEWAAMLRNGAIKDREVARGVERGWAEVAFLGVGVNDRGVVRTNVYLKAAAQ